MKKSLFLGKTAVFFMLAFALAPLAKSQSSLELLSQGCGHSHDNVIVRMSYDHANQADYAVTYQTSNHSLGNERMFMWSDASFSTVEFDLAQESIYVHDFQIFNDMVYFCGTKSGSAIFGYYAVSDFQAPSTNIDYYTFYPSPSSTPYPQVFTKIKMYIDPTTLEPCAAMVGYDSAYSYSFLSIVNAVTGEHHYYYEKFWFSIEDVAVTDDYIVAVGENDHSSKANIYRIKKNNINNVDIFTLTTTEQTSFNSVMVIENLIYNDIAFAALYIDMTGNHYMNVYTYDIQGVVCKNVQSVPVINKCNADDLLFMPYDKSLLLLLKNDYPYLQQNSSLIFYLDPYNNNYTTNLLYDQDNKFFTLDRFFNVSDTRFIVGSEKPGGIHRYYIHDKSVFTTSCILFDNIQIVKREFPKVTSLSISMFNGSNTFHNIQIGNHLSTIYLNCHQ